MLGDIYIALCPCQFMTSSGARKFSVGGPKQIFFGKYIKWEGRNKIFSKNTHKIANKYTNGLGSRGEDPPLSSHSSAHVYDGLSPFSMFYHYLHYI